MCDFTAGRAGEGGEDRAGEGSGAEAKGCLDTRGRGGCRGRGPGEFIGLRQTNGFAAVFAVLIAGRGGGGSVVGVEGCARSIKNYVLRFVLDLPCGEQDHQYSGNPRLARVLASFNGLHFVF